jgi:hypothetical protein
MVTAKQIWEAGRAALGLAVANPSPTPSTAPAGVEESAPDVSEQTALALELVNLQDRAYRVHFRGGTSGEYNGVQLGICAPFDLSEVVSIDPV